MDLSQFKKSAVNVKASGAKKSSSNPITRTLVSFKDWLYPPITTLRQQRIKQYQDLALFAGAALTVAIFEDKIKNFL
jgi:hypothetical protein